MRNVNLSPTARQSGRNPLMVAAAAVLLVLAAGACQTKANTVAAVTSTTEATAATTTSTIAPTTSVAPRTTTTAKTATTNRAPIVSPVTTTTVNPTCAQKAALRYIRTTGAGWANHEFEVSGYAAQLVCGGPDDSHFVVSTTLERLVLAPTARVTVIDRSNGITVKPISPSDLPGFLQANPSGHYFEVSGAATSVTALAEQYRP